MLTTCGGTARQNCTYIKNPNHPSAETETSACSFNIAKCDSTVCDFRLDFEQFSTNGPADTIETDGGRCQDVLNIQTVGYV